MRRSISVQFQFLFSFATLLLRLSKIFIFLFCGSFCCCDRWCCFSNMLFFSVVSFLLLLLLLLLLVPLLFPPQGAYCPLFLFQARCHCQFLLHKQSFYIFWPCRLFRVVKVFMFFYCWLLLP